MFDNCYINVNYKTVVKSKYLPKTANLMVRYNKLGSQFADFSNNVAFLTRCANMMMVPKSHRVYNDHVRNTRAVVRLLDQCSYRVMIADLEHNRRRKYQVMKNRERIEIRLKDIMSPEDFEEVRKICDENREVHFTEVKERQRKEYQDLLDEYKTHETKKTRRRNNSHRTEGESSVSPNPAAEHRDQRDEAHGAAGGSYQNKNEKPNGKEVSDTGGSAETKIASNNESVSKNSKNDDKSRHDSELPSASQKNVGTGSLALARAPKDKTEKDDKSNSKKASNKSSNIEVKAVFSNEGLAKYSKGESSTKSDGKSLNDSDLSSTLQKKSGTDVQEFAEASKEKAKETSASVKPKTNTDESSKGK
ncbi:knob-associated histidine-rich protein-like isoform X2 [Varroa jacobsoni]|uniref:knob-associated histidine-rich protein-like isoform X2 n=1 Tax=Varroa jacobsoni TaxID=62625 RepID=UPI000BFA376F|nr:knob-associated histidine-rich protein-like isoform X2 [Varroa jacobsoni]XP_022699590.1 knob-associated histidine-rich protein-like isoform X2 [Varroa jacobsoni]